MPEAVAVRRHVLDDIVAHARDEAPNECCGLLIGPVDDGASAGRPADPGPRVSDHVRCRNTCASPARYTLDPADHFAALRRLRGTERQVLGAYHSHPRSPAIPSETDRREAAYPEFIWLIVSLATDSADIRAYRLREGNFVPIPLVPVP